MSNYITLKEDQNPGDRGLGEISGERHGHMVKGWT